MKLEGSKLDSRLPTDLPILPGNSTVHKPGILREQLFHKLLRMEKKRGTRGNHPVMLMVLDVDSIEDPDQRADALSAMASVLPRVLRLTDIKGWYEKDVSLGVVLTEIGSSDPRVVREKVSRKIARALLEAGPVTWDGPIGSTTSIFVNGGEPCIETGVLELPRTAETQHAPVVSAPVSPSAGFFPRGRLPLVLMDLICILVSFLLINWSRYWDGGVSSAVLNVEFFTSAAVILSALFLFGFYRVERPFLGRHRILHVVLATSSVAVAAVLCTNLYWERFFHPDHFVGQTLAAWLIILSWKIIYGRHRLRTHAAKSVWVENRNTLKG